MEGPSTQASETVLSISVKEVTTEPTKAKSKKPSLRVLSRVVIAVKKFGASLNPTVDFRKRNPPQDAFPQQPLQETKKQISQRPQLLKRMYTHNASGQLVPRKTRPNSGNKSYYLAKAFFPHREQS